jgi:hypothetical protein
MQKLLQTAGAISLWAASLIAQDATPLPAPADVTLHLQTEGDQHEFRLGERIPIQGSYRAAVAGKYLQVMRTGKLSGGRNIEISCSPRVELVESSLKSPADDRFRTILRAGCLDFSGGSSAGICSDCDGEWPLGPAPISFSLPLNTYVRFRTAGTYTCTASVADVTTVPRSEKIRPALLVKSNPVVLNIVDDPAWAHSTAIAYGDAYRKQCQGDNVPGQPFQEFQECSKIAQRITYLDTPDSLAVEVKLYDGRNHGWDNGFWRAIQHTSHQGDALRLMTERMQDPDFEVSTTILESLPEWELQFESPDAFQTVPPTAYHITAVKKLRKYTRLLGSSLAHKNSDVLQESAKTYRAFADAQYCEEHPLISEHERNQVLTAAGIRP